MPATAKTEPGHQMIYIVGAPGAGKSTLMARLTEPYDRVTLTDVEVPHDALFSRPDDDCIGAEIGRRRELFSGTDALSSSIIERAVPWIANRPYPLLFAEGARLGNRRFILTTARAGYAVTLVHLDHEDVGQWRDQRAEAIGKAQNPAWVRGQTTAARRLVEVMADDSRVTVLTGHPDEVYPQIVALLPDSRVTISVHG